MPGVSRARRPTASLKQTDARGVPLSRVGAAGVVEQVAYDSDEQE